MAQGVSSSTGAATLALGLLLILSVSARASADKALAEETIQVGVRAYYLLDDMDDSPLKKTLQDCGANTFTRTDFSIAHRGAPLQFPEHTRESYRAAVRMGAGMVECDVTFTSDRELVCRHSQCDLHTTTDIVATALGKKCSQPFQPAVYSSTGVMESPASAKCCTSDITVAEFKTLRGKMDGSNPGARTPVEYLDGTESWRTDLYASRGTLMTHRESIELFSSLNVKMAPELKAPEVAMPFGGFTQHDYARKMIQQYQDAGIAAKYVRPQSFSLSDVLFWLNETPEFGERAMYLDERAPSENIDTRDITALEADMKVLADQGVQTIAPPLWMLLDVRDGAVVPSVYARAARAAGLNIIAWTLERSGPLSEGGGYYYQTLNGLNQDSENPQIGVVNNDGDVFTVLDVLAREVGVIGVFSDWPGTVTYYANCMDL
jgi:glycerophosphoryl diester phosphodiesterase